MVWPRAGGPASTGAARVRYRDHRDRSDRNTRPNSGRCRSSCFGVIAVGMLVRSGCWRGRLHSTRGCATSPIAPVRFRRAAAARVTGVDRCVRLAARRRGGNGALAPSRRHDRDGRVPADVAARRPRRDRCAALSQLRRAWLATSTWYRNDTTVAPYTEAARAGDPHRPTPAAGDRGAGDCGASTEPVHAVRAGPIASTFTNR